MEKKHKVVAVIPARGGSKSIPHKNIALLAGKPLIAWTIEVAQQVKKIDRIIVSTDDAAIKKVSLQFGAEVYDRPDQLATDDALVIDTLRHLVKKLESEGEKVDILVLLEPTCPLRNAEDVRNCIDRLSDLSIDSVATFKEAELNPCRAWKINNVKPEVFIEGVDPWLPRQKLPEAYQLNGAVYAFRVNKLSTTFSAILFGNAAAVVMPKERSVDIDGYHDLYLAESIITRGNRT